MKNKFSIAMSLAVILAILLASLALADQIVNNVDATIDSTFEVKSLTIGSPDGTVGLYVVPTNNDTKNGCNLTGSTTLVVAVTSSNPSIATVSPSSITFSNCNPAPTAATTITIHPVAAGSTDVTLTQTSNSTGGTFDLTTAGFTVNVANPTPTNHAPNVSVTGVTTGASYEYGSVPSAGCSVTDAEDGTKTVAPVLGDLTGPLANYGLGSQDVTCSYTDTGGLTTTASVTYAIVDTTAPSLSVPSDFSVEATSGAGATVTYSVTAKDAVDSAPTINCSPASGSGFLLGTTLVSCAATDVAGNTSATKTFNITVQDTTPPDLTVPANISKEATGPSGATVNYTVSATDAVSGVITPTCDSVSGATFPIGTSKVTCSATDSSGNTASRSFTVSVVDTAGPALNVPGDLTVEATSTSGAVVNYSASATDLVDGSVAVNCSAASGSIFAFGTSTVTCSATDKTGNSSTASFNVTVADTTPPSFSSLTDISAEATSASGAVASFSASASDTVDGPITPSCSPASGSTFALGTTTVTCSATDAHGNTAKDTFTVTVQDTTPPTLKLSNDLTVEATGPSGAVVTYTVSASDLVDGAVTPSCSPASGSTFALDTTTVTCSATDAHGNKSSGTFTVIVADNTPPTVSVPSNIIAEATGPSGAVVTYSGASASDLVDGAVPPTCLPASGSTFALGAATVTCSATDAHGNTGTGSFTVTVEDTTPPTVKLPSNITAEATSALGAAVSYSASATDLVDGSPAADCSPASGSTFALGTTTVNCAATDAHGNMATGSFTVTVEDTTPPTLKLPSNLTAEATSASGAAISYSASATDLVDGTVTVNCSPASGSTFALGTATVSCSAKDAQGNTATGGFTVTVKDTTPPALSLPSDMSTFATGNSSALVTYTASATDLVDGSVSVTCTPASGSSFAAGTTTVSCSATDSHSNTATGSFKVTVNYNWTGFFQPVDNNGVLNVAKAGSTIPVKFSLGADQGLAILASGSPSSVSISCSATATTDAIEETTTATSGLKYDPVANQYIYNWKTASSYAGTCRQLTVKLADGSVHTALFKFTK